MVVVEELTTTEGAVSPGARLPVGYGLAPRLPAPVAEALSLFSLGKGLVGRVENDRLFLTQALYPTVLVLLLSLLIHRRLFPNTITLYSNSISKATT